MLRDFAELSKNVLLVAAFMMFVALLWLGLRQETTRIEEIAVPDSVDQRGYDSAIAARRLRDELVEFEDAAVTNFAGLQKAAAAAEQEPEKDKKIAVSGDKGAAPPASASLSLEAQSRAKTSYSVKGDLTEAVVPSTGLSVDAIAGLIRSLIPESIRASIRKDPHRITGEVSETDEGLWLHLRYDDHPIYNSAKPSQNMEELFSDAVPNVLRAIGPHLAIYHSDNSTDALKLAVQILKNEFQPKIPHELIQQNVANIVASIGPHAFVVAQTDPQAALKLVESIIAELPAGANAAPLHALKGALNRKYPRIALANYDKAIDLDPNEAAVLVDRGLAYIEDKQYDNAIADLKKASELDANNAKTHYNLGAAFLYNSQIDEAAQAFSEAIALDPESAVFHSGRGTAYLQATDYDLAIADFTKAVQIDPDLAAGYNNRGIAYARKGEFDLAIEDYTGAIRLDPQYVHAFANRADAYLKTDRVQGAIRDLTAAISVDPKYAEAYGKRGQAYLGLGDLQRSASDLKKAIALNANDTQSYDALAMAQVLAGDNNSAIANLERVIAAYPDNPYAPLWLYLARAREGDADASALLRRQRETLQGEGWPRALYDFFLGRKSPEQVLAVANDRSQQCEAQFYIGQGHLLRGERADAAQSFEAATADCPPHLLETIGAKVELERLARPETTSPPQPKPQVQ
jgi:tetratricopeptide (TPR) repeat protein